MCYHEVGVNLLQILQRIMFTQNKPKMKKATKIMLMLCFIFSGAFCLARNEDRMVEMKGIPIEIKDSTGSISGSDRGNSIIPTLNGHVLTVVFSENIGQVYVDVSLVEGGETQVESTPTPNGVIFYIPDAGSYVVTFTLSNGDVYYGEFTVTD